MKTTILVLTAVISSVLTHSVLAENHADMMPPPGPYRSISDVDQYTENQSVQNESKQRLGEGFNSAPSSQMNNNVPDWVQHPQTQAGNGMYQQNTPQTQGWNNPPPQRNYNYAPPMPNVYSAPAPGFQNNRMRQPFPYARGPVYGPGVPPADYYRQPMPQAPRY
ncbi:MAG: hypothetical protein ABUK13_01780 [Gammaproteobacteria bacterium]